MTLTSTAPNPQLLYGDQYEDVPGIRNLLLYQGTSDAHSWLKGIADSWVATHDDLMPMHIVLVTESRLLHSLQDAGAGPDLMLRHAQRLIDLSQHQFDPITTAHVMGEAYFMTVENPTGTDLTAINHAAQNGMVEQWGDTCISLTTLTAGPSGRSQVAMVLRNVDDEQREFAGEWQAVDVTGDADQPILRGFKAA